jgi:signal transduction histidine kinase
VAESLIAYPSGVRESHNRMNSWLRSAIRPPDGHPTPASYVRDRLAGDVAALLRVVVSVVGGAAALIGLAPPASPRWVVPAVAANLLWSLGFGAFALRYGLRGWLTALDVCGTAALCLLQVHVTARDALPAGAGWVEVTASVTIVVCHFTWRLPAASAGGLVVVAGYLAGASRADLDDHGIGQAVIYLIQIALAGLLMVLIRRASGAADRALSDRVAAQAQAQAGQARRHAEREHNRQLHDTVLATLTMVGTGAIRGDSPILRRHALADLGLIDGLNAVPRAVPVIPAQRRPEPETRVGLHERLAEATGRARGLAVELHVAGCRVPVPVADAFVAATGQALVNVAQHAGTGRARVWLRVADGVVRVVVADDGPGFDPQGVPASRYGIREAIVGRMRAVGGQARVRSRPGAGTTVLLEWHDD